MRNKTIWPLLFILILWTGSAWGASYTVCSSGCSGTVADFEAGTAPFDNLNGDTVTFTEDQTDKLSLKATAYGTTTATLIGTGTTITVSLDSCLETNAADKVTIQGFTFIGGNGNTPSVDVEALSDNITITDCSIRPVSGARGLRINRGTNRIITNNTFDGNDLSIDLLYYFAGDTYNSNGDVITGNTFSNTGATGRAIHFVSINTGHFYNITIGTVASPNTFTANAVGAHSIYLDPDDVDDTASYGIDINGNIFTDVPGIPVALERVTSTGGTSYIRNNTLTNIALTSGAASINGLRVGGVSGVVIEGNTINGVYSTVGDGNGIIIDRWNPSTNLKSTNTIVRYNSITGCNSLSYSAGISNYSSDDTLIHDNKLYGNVVGIKWGEATDIGDYSSGGLIYNNTIHNNSKYGLMVREYASTSTWINNIAWSNTIYDLALMALGTAPTSSYNCYATIAPDDATYDEWAAGTGDVTSDPLFKSATDFHLQPGSPCIGTGTPIAGIYTDFDGWMRRYPESIGAYADHSRYKGYNNINFRISGNPARGANVDNSLIEIDE